MTSMNPGTKVACMPVEAMCQLKGGSEMVNRISGKALLLVIFCISMSLLLSCAGKKRVRRSLPEGFNHHLKQAILYYDEGQCEKAIPEFDKVIEISPRYSSAYAHRGYCYLQENLYDEATEDFSKAIELQPENASYYEGRGRVCLERQLYEKAIADFTVAVKLNPKAGNYNYLGSARLLNNEFDLAIADFGKAIDFAPKWAKPYIGRGTALLSKGDYDLAILDFKKALDLDPTAEDVCRTCLLETFEKVGRTDEALAFLDNVLKADPYNSEIYHERAFFWQKKADFSRAIADYEKAIALNPNHSDSYNNLAWILATCPDERYRDGERAIKLAKNAVQLPKNAEEEWYSIGTLAAAYAEVGRFGDAIKTQEKALALLEESGEDPKTISDAKKMLENYKASKPWREPQN